jgi:hypothetical protein
MRLAVCSLVAVIGLGILPGFAPAAAAGGPRYVAGVSYFDPGVKGIPLTWSQGTVRYYTDQGDLSAILQNTGADNFVAEAFSRWTSISTAAISATRAGQLNENVDGTNVFVDGGGNITMPLDIQPTATDKPVAVVYDADGAVTDALLGSGAGSDLLCFSNAVMGGIDNFSTDGHLVHALVVINGNCAQNSAQLPDVKYRLVRTLGRVLGLDWSQLNKNAQTGSPHPTPDDYAGLPVMHQVDLYECVPISLCYPNADQPKMDDIAAISRLYPVTSANLSNFPGKEVFAARTGRVHGSVRFIDAGGQPGQPMQGANVVAQWIDPTTNNPSHRYAISSVSGFLFRGNAGNTVTGFNDALGQLFDRFGSDDVALEGFFDLGGLPFPDGRNTAQYEISVEALDPDWSQQVGPYRPWQVRPSGSVQPVVITVARGGDVAQDILMPGSASEAEDMRDPQSWDAPAAAPDAGDWIGSLSGYGDVDYFRFSGQANRTLSVEVQALDDFGSPAQDKARPVIGMWALAAPPGTSPGAATPTAFNTYTSGLSRLDAVLLQSTDFRVGVADERGDGRPDYRYHARLLYADKILPARIGVGSRNVLGIRGMGFRPGLSIGFGENAVPATVLSMASNLAIVSPPVMTDGLYSVTLRDATTGGSSTISDALTVGAAPGDSIVLLSGLNPPTPAGTEAANPVRVRVLAADGVTPVTGASVQFSSYPPAALAACGGASSCTMSTYDNGEALTRVTPPSPGTFIITASLAPASYQPAKFVQGTVSAPSSSLAIAVVAPYRWIAENASLDLPVSARVVESGLPVGARAVTFEVLSGSAFVTPSSTSTDANGYANTTVQVRNLAGGLQISACVSPGFSPCATLTVAKVALANLKLHRMAGNAQLVPIGEPFSPVVVQVTDSSTPSNPVQGATVDFSQYVFRSDNDAFDEPAGEIGSNYPMPVILASSKNTVTSDVTGMASLIPSEGNIDGPIEIEIVASIGTGAEQWFEVESLGISDSGTSTASKRFAPLPARARRHH